MPYPGPQSLALGLAFMWRNVAAWFRSVITCFFLCFDYVFVSTPDGILGTLMGRPISLEMLGIGALHMGSWIKTLITSNCALPLSRSPMELILIPESPSSARTSSAPVSFTISICFFSPRFRSFSVSVTDIVACTILILTPALLKKDDDVVLDAVFLLLDLPSCKHHGLKSYSWDKAGPLITFKVCSSRRGSDCPANHPEM